MPSYTGAPGGMTTSQDFTALEPVLLSRAREVVERETLLTSGSFVTKMNLPAKQGRYLRLPRFTQRWEARNIVEGQPINNPQRLVPDIQQFTTYQIGIDYIQTDETEWFMPEPIMAMAGRMMGNAIKRRQEEDMIALFNHPSRTIGGPGQTFNPNWLAAVRNRLMENTEIFPFDPAKSPPIAMMHSYSLYPILALSGTIGSNAFSGGRAPIYGWTEELIRRFDIRELYGQPITTHSMLPIDANDDVVGSIFTKDAYLFITTGQMLKTERERDVSLRATYIATTSHYGVGFLDDQYAFRMICDASLPS